MKEYANTDWMVRFTCDATKSSADGKATSVYSTSKKGGVVPKSVQHHYSWIKGWTEEKDCDRDEWPPRAFWPVAKRNKLGQRVRFLPGSDNRGAGSMWNGFCKKYGKENLDLHHTYAKQETVKSACGTTSGCYLNKCTILTLTNPLVQQPSLL
jgi:hypothetical protein